jgi:hypothetical protein
MCSAGSELTLVAQNNESPSKTGESRTGMVVSRCTGGARFDTFRAFPVTTRKVNKVCGHTSDSDS